MAICTHAKLIPQTPYPLPWDHPFGPVTREIAVTQVTLLPPFSYLASRDYIIKRCSKDTALGYLPLSMKGIEIISNEGNGEVQYWVVDG